MATASLRPHATAHIKAGVLTHSSQQAMTDMKAALKRRFDKMRTLAAAYINTAVHKLLEGALAKMDVHTLEEFKQATAGKTRYSVNHLFSKPLQRRPGNKRPYGKHSEIKSKTLKLKDLSPTQFWLKPQVVIDYATVGENPSKGQTEDKPIHVVGTKKGEYLVSDGHHRVAAALLNGEKTIDAVVFPRWATDDEIAAKKVALAVGRVAKADSYDDVVNDIMEALKDEFASVPGDVEPMLQSASLSGLSQGVIAIDVTDTGLLNEVNTTAQEWATGRAAELVGMKYDDEGNLVPNPAARWRITDTTRNKLQGIVEEAFAEQSSMADIAAAIDEAGIFNSARAEMIARTEISRAQVMGNLEMWIQSGAVSQVNWLVSEEAPCDECMELADGSPYDIGDAPVPIDDSHPNCMCILAAVVEEE